MNVNPAHGILVDCKMSEEEAFKNLSADCPDEIRQNQKILDVQYPGFDGKIHAGQVIVDHRVEEDVRRVFELIRKIEFPVQSMILLSDSRFTKNGVWDDDLSMEAGNGSAFNYRPITGGGKLSYHALGLAIDFNPHLNPFFEQVEVNEHHSHYKLGCPSCGVYDVTKPGTLTGRHPVVELFLELGWMWGGNWQFPLDYHHFNIDLGKKPELRDYVERIRG